MPLLTASPAQADVTLVLDALPRLSYRDRHHTVPAADPAPGRYFVLDDGDTRALLPLAEGMTRLGRGFGAGVSIDDPTVSRRHAILSAREGQVRLLDDRSANGTYVNGRRITATELHDGDVVVLGRVALTFRDIPAARRFTRRAAERRVAH